MIFSIETPSFYLAFVLVAVYAYEEECGFRKCSASTPGPCFRKRLDRVYTRMEGTPFLLSCEFGGTPALYKAWWYDNSQAYPVPGTFINITTLSIANNGVMSCQWGRYACQNAQLVVLVRPRQIRLEAVSGESVTASNELLVRPSQQTYQRLACLVDGGNPPPDFAWYQMRRDAATGCVTKRRISPIDRVDPSQTPTKVVTFRSEVRVPVSDIAANDSVQCEVSNEATKRETRVKYGILVANVTLRVERPIGRVTLRLREASGRAVWAEDGVSVGTTLEVICEADSAGYPEARLQLTKREHNNSVTDTPAMTHVDRVMDRLKTRMRLVVARADHNAVITCVASNGLKSIRAPPITLKVLFPHRDLRTTVWRCGRPKEIIGTSTTKGSTNEPSSGLGCNAGASGGKTATDTDIACDSVSTTNRLRSTKRNAMPTATSATTAAAYSFWD